MCFAPRWRVAVCSSAIDLGLRLEERHDGSLAMLQVAT